MTNRDSIKVNKVLIVIFFIAAIMLSACQMTQSDAEERAAIRYQNVTGYEISVPEDWQLIKQTPDGGAFFLSGDYGISLSIYSEVGGMNYLNVEEISDSVYQRLMAVITEAKVVQILAVGDSSREYRQLIEGKDPNGDPVLADVWLIQPMDGMRYYTVFCCGGDDYAKNKSAYDKVIDSFQIYLEQDDIYSLFTLSEEDLAKKLENGMKMAD